MSRVERRMVYRDSRLALGSLFVGIAGAALWALGLWLDPERAMFAYLAAFCFAVSVGVGALIFLQCCYAVNGKWTAAIRRLNEAVVSTLVPAAILFIPIAVGAPRIYPWLEPSPELPHHVTELLARRSPYLNLPFFVIRAAVFLVLFAAVGTYLHRWSRRRDEDDPAAIADPELALRRPRVVASVTLPLVGLALTFAAFDWMMSIHANWFSTMFGLYVFAGGFLAAVGLIAALLWGAGRRALGPELTRYHVHALGRLVFGLTVLWAYCGFFQAMLIRNADLPREVTFYLTRTASGWEAVTWALIVGHFAIPFVLLLPRAPRMVAALVGAVGLWQLAFHYVDIDWLVVPEAAGGEASPGHWVDLAALAAVAGPCTAWAAWRQRGRPLLATGDPFLPAALEYRSG